MKMTTRNQLDHEWRHALLAGVAAVAVGMAPPALAQQQGGSGQVQGGQAQTSASPSQQPAVGGQIRTAEQALRQAMGQVSGGQSPDWAQARTAVESGLTVIGRAPQQIQGQDVWRTAQRQLNEAQQALQGGQPNQQQATSQMREAADALGTLAGRVGGSADSSKSTSGGSTSAGAAGSGAQITVQQPQPQITVTQPQPQVTVTQPRPQVTVQQPQPQVTVRQAEPQVTVQQQGPPQVTVQRQGEPQVTVQRPNQDAAANGSSQRSGTTAVPTPSQSGGSQPQRAAVTSSGGMALQSVQDMVGKNVVGSNGRDAGEVQNLLIDNAGRVRAAVIEWGGFLGIGDRQAMVPIDRIQLSQGGNDRARLNMTREELEALPRYDRDHVADYGRQQGWGDGLRLYR